MAFSSELPYDVRESKQMLHCDMDGKVLSLRDRFAMSALIGFQSFVRGGWAGVITPEHALHVAQNCYALADAMLKAREANEPPVE